MTKEQQVKKAIEKVLFQFDYADYIGIEVGNFKRGLTTEELKLFKEMCFNNWLVEKGIVEVQSFKEWEKQKKK